MKYFTKEWYYSDQDPFEKMEIARNGYEQYYKTVEHLLPEDIKMLNMHDSQLIKMYYDGDDYVMEFDVYKISWSPDNKLIFKNAQILESDEFNLSNRYVWLYEEVYLIDGKYEFHILFAERGGGDRSRPQMIILADNFSARLDCSLLPSKKKRDPMEYEHDDVEAIFELNFAGKWHVLDEYSQEYLIDDQKTFGLNQYHDVMTIAPNETAKGTIRFGHPNYPAGCLWVGKKIAMLKREKIIGYATITKIFNPVLSIQENDQ